MANNYHFLLTRLQELQPDTAPELLALFAAAFVFRKYQQKK